MTCGLSVHTCLNPVPEAGLPRSGKNICKMKFFAGQGKSGNFVNGQGSLERTWNVRETSGNLKKKMAMAGSLQKIYSVQEGKRCTFSEIV